MSYTRDGKEFIMIDDVEEEIVKIASDAHDTGYFTGYRSQMTEGQVEYIGDGPQPGDRISIQLPGEMTNKDIIKMIEGANIVIPKGCTKKADLLELWNNTPLTAG